MVRERKSAVIARRRVGEAGDLYFPLIVHEEKRLNRRQNEESADENDGPSLFVELVMIGAEEDRYQWVIYSQREAEVLLECLHGVKVCQSLLRVKVCQGKSENPHSHKLIP